MLAKEEMAPSRESRTEAFHSSNAVQSGLPSVIRPSRLLARMQHCRVKPIHPAGSQPAELAFGDAMASQYRRYR
jgi:hypothetical protein